MGFSSDIYSEVLENKRRLRQRNEALSDANRKKLYAENPRIREIENKLLKIGMETTLAVFSGNKEKLETLKIQCLKLNEEKKKLLAGSSLNVPYACEKCRDSGFFEGHYCDCVKREAKAIQFKRLSSVAPFEECRFSTFSLDYYSTDSTDGKVSPRVRMEKNLNYIKRFAENFPTGENLLLVGGAGLGKTHLSIAAANAVIERGFGVFYSSADYLLTKLERERFGRSGNNYKYYDAIEECDLLVLDDLGTEFLNQFGKAAIYDIINTRILAKKPVIINTNLFMDELAERYTPRISSRLIGNYTSLLFDGSDIRQQKLK